MHLPQVDVGLQMPFLIKVLGLNDFKFHRLESWFCSLQQSESACSCADVRVTGAYTVIT